MIFMKLSVSKILAAALTAALVIMALAACHPRHETASPPQTGPAAASQARATSTGTAVAPAAAGTSLPGDQAVTPRYRIAITLPSLPADEAPLAKALRTTADHAKREFLRALPDPKQFPEFADRQLLLRLDFDLAAQTAAFTSVRESGSEDTGGAHPLPVQSSFVYDRSAGRLVTLDDLFSDPDAARKGLAAYVREKLSGRLTAQMTQALGTGEGSPEAIREGKTSMMQMLNDGTQPSADNYAVFIVRAGARETDPSPGLLLIFPPYQVAPYAFGTQTVEVPAAVFAKFLKPRYRSAFAADRA